MNSAGKIILLEDLPRHRVALRETRRTLVVTSGCFDLLHVGHIMYLEAARTQGDFLLVGVNGDESVRQLKGPTRPLNSERDRARVLAALECIDAVCIFPEKRATRFLSLVLPDIWVKGGDYSLDSLDQEERRAVEDRGGRIVFIPFMDGKSTTALVEKLHQPTP